MQTHLAVAFAGTPQFAVPALDAIQASPHSVAVVYTQPDRPAGRGRELKPGPVKQRALELGLPLQQPATLRDAAAAGVLAGYRADVMVVVAYGLLLPPAILEVPRLGCINIHASLLPRWRGAAPIQRAILAGDDETGVCIMRMEAGLDTGPVMRREALAIAADENADSLHDRLATAGAGMIVEALDLLAGGRATFVAQVEQGACYARKLDKAEADIDWTRPATEIDRQVRAFNPWPVAETQVNGERLRIWQARVVDGVADAPPGTIIAAGPTGIDVMTGAGALALQRVQRAGRAVVSAREFAQGRELVGQRLG